MGLLKGVKVAVFGVRCIDLTKDAMKILGIYSSYNKNIEPEQNFKKVIIRIEKVLRISKRWLYQNLYF